MPGFIIYIPTHLHTLKGGGYALPFLAGCAAWFSPDAWNQRRCGDDALCQLGMYACLHVCVYVCFPQMLAIRGDVAMMHSVN